MIGTQVHDNLLYQQVDGFVQASIEVASEDCALASFLLVDHRDHLNDDDGLVDSILAMAVAPQ